jgi:hypothetical protein
MKSSHKTDHLHTVIRRNGGLRENLLYINVVEGIVFMKHTPQPVHGAEHPAGSSRANNVSNMDTTVPWLSICIFSYQGKPSSPWS